MWSLVISTGKFIYVGEEFGKEYYTVNPVAINSPVNVFTENKRKLTIIESPEFGKVRARACVASSRVLPVIML